MFTLIVPAAGKTVNKPYWLELHPTGNLMIYEGLRGLDLNVFDRIVITIQKEIDIRYEVSNALKLQFSNIGLLHKLNILSLNEQTKNEPETVYQTIIQENIKGPIFIKDTDNYFECKTLPGNYIVTYPMDQLVNVNPQNKSYLLINDDDYIENIIEKELISKFFCVGGYGFNDANIFCEYYLKLNSYEYLYLSHVIYCMLLNHLNFKPLYTEKYFDWGTLTDWQNYLSKYKTLFIDLEGIILKSEILNPNPSKSIPISKNINLINKIFNSGFITIIILTKRDFTKKTQTLNQLNEIGIKFHDIIFNISAPNKILISQKEQHLLNDLTTLL